MSTSEPKLDELLAEFDARTDPYHEGNLAHAIQALPSERGETAQPTFRELAEGIAFGVAETGPPKTPRWGTYYGPTTVLRTDDGEEHEIPSIAHITPAMLDYWEARADAARHPRLKARYADLVWDLSWRVAQRRPDVRFAQTTVDATLELIAGRHCKYSCDAHCKLRRALAVALGINDAKRAEAVRDAAIAYERHTAVDGEPGTWGLAFDLMIEGRHKSVLTDEQERQIIADLETRLARVAPHFNPFGTESAALRLARYYRRRNLPNDLCRVMRTYVRAWASIAERVMPVLAAAWLRSVHQTLLDFGLKSDADDLEPQLRTLEAHSHENMAAVSHSVTFTREEVETFLNGMTSGTLSDTLTRIAIYFLPDPAKAREQVLKSAKQFPLMALFSKCSLDGDGRVLAEVGSVRDDLDGQVIVRMAEDLSSWQPFLRMALERARSRHDLTAGGLLSFLFQSPPFRPENRAVVERGLRAFLDDDLAVAIHLLVPQIEAAIRNLVARGGGPVYEPGRHGSTKFRNLDKLLSDPGLVALLPDQIVSYLRVLLTDQRGWNVRNTVCHGLAGSGALGPPMADRVIHALLLLGLVREAPPSQQTSGDPLASDPALPC
jgi:hypothetical protein